MNEPETKPNIKTSNLTTASYKIIIPADLTTLKFNKNTYKELHLSQYISKNEYDEIINNSSKIMYNSWNMKITNDTFSQPKLFISFEFKIVVLLILYIVSLFVATLVNSFIVIFVSCGLFGAAFFLMVFLSILNIKKPLIIYKTLDEILDTELCKYFEEINKKYTCLNFKFNSENYCIECTILSNVSIEEEGKINENGEQEGKSNINNDKKTIEENKPLVNDINSNNKSIKTNRIHGDSTNINEKDLSKIDANPKQMIELIDMNRD